MTTQQQLALDVILLDADVQPRDTMSSNLIREYAALYAEGQDLPPITVFQDGQEYWLADGFHRVSAAREAGLDEIAAEVREGTKRDAMLYACGANLHGKSRTNEDKRRAVTRLLQDGEWAMWSNSEIARHCGVAHSLVGKLRRSLDSESSEQPKRTYRTKHGTVATMDTSAIGAHPAPAGPAQALSTLDLLPKRYFGHCPRCEGPALLARGRREPLGAYLCTTCGALFLPAQAPPLVSAWNTDLFPPGEDTPTAPPTIPCRVCGDPLDDDAWHCHRCGEHAALTQEACPTCRHVRPFEYFPPPTLGPITIRATDVHPSITLRVGAPWVPISEAAVADEDIRREEIEALFPPRPQAPVLHLIPDPPPTNGTRHTFNRTNENVDWAKWTWNPVTGCLHNCVYCYARDIAERHD
jgi:hypothetical protein